MTISKELSSITIPVAHYRLYNEITEENVSFTIYQENEWFKAVPVLSMEERLATGLPEELLFLYINYCIADANDMEDDALAVIKKIILELEVQELI
jgi:hypothetical protein